MNTTAQTGARYAAAFERSMTDPEGFWLEAAQGIDWYREPTQAFDPDSGPYGRWFPDGELNTSYNALDRHVLAGHGDRVALIYDSPVVGKVREYTYENLLSRVARFSHVLADAGVAKGDRVLIYMPMIPQAVVAMLACARLGAVHSVVFGGFAAKELKVRIDDARPKVIITASGGIEPNRVIEYLPTVREAIETAEHRVETVVVKDRPEIPGTAAEFEGTTPGTQWWDWASRSIPTTPYPAIPVRATDPLYILYTSGTTGTPKGVVRDNGGHAVALQWSMKNIYDIDPGDVWFTASDIGWVVGHSYIVYAPLLAGATTIMYEGKPVGTPDAGAFWRVAEQHRVNALFTAPTALRAIRRVDADGEFAAGRDLSALRSFFLAGERLDPETWSWAGDLLGKPVIDHWWQTETGWAICANLRGLDPMPLKAGSPSVPVPGYRVEVLDGNGKPVPAGTEGNIAIRLPLPPGALPTLWGGDERFESSYTNAIPGYYATGDSGYVDEDGYVFVMGRADDVINVAGHRLSTGSMEQSLLEHPALAEAAVVGAKDELKGQVPVGFVVLKAGVDIPEDQLVNELVAQVRGDIGAVAAFRHAVVVPRLPKTRSGKVLRKTIRQIVDGDPDVRIPATIEEPAVIDDIREASERLRASMS
ncbi:AMP-binding protein [Microbacterium gorillae]|uniref:AMP-binding protein n=1 Tax=Microbacterium gorillae TaxID=1231063 RepID=UPI00058E33C4|nr:AMP-binding protein [Microbacterium gorillae]